MPPSDRPIFVVGCPRSGTTLFRTMLSAHRSIAIPPETRYLMGMYWRRNELGDLRRKDARVQLASAIVDDPETRFRVLELDGDALAKALAAFGLQSASGGGRNEATTKRPRAS